MDKIKEKNFKITAHYYYYYYYYSSLLLLIYFE